MKRLALGALLLAVGAGCPTPVTFVVNTTSDLSDADPGDGLCQAAGNGACSLRAAIQEANAQPVSSNNVIIDIALPGTFSFVPDDVNGFVIEPGRRVVVQGFNNIPGDTVIEPDHSRTSYSRIFTVLGGGFELHDLTLRGGRLEPPPSGASNRGGAVLGEEGGAYSILVEHCVLEDNDGGHRGGAIYADDGPGASLSIQDTVVRNNSATLAGIGGAGGVHSLAATSVSDTLFEGNEGNGGGLRIDANGGVHDISRSAFYSNDAGTAGGGFRVDIGGAGTLTVSFSTVSNNTAPSAGAGIWVASGNVQLRHVTITENTGPAVGQGLTIASEGAVTLAETLIAQNPILPLWSGGDVSCSGGATLDSDGFNLINGVAPACNLAFDLTNIIGTEDEPVWAHLTDYEASPIGHHDPYPDSPAVDAGLFICGGTDQVGNPRPVGGRCDIGAIEPPRLSEPSMNR